MNYFEFYNIEETLRIDLKLVKRKFLEMSRKYHPDFYGNESVEKQEEVLEFSTLNTNAFNTLKNINKTIEYVLNLHRLLEEDNKLPPSFLMNMMEINEQLMELEFTFDNAILDTIKNNVVAIELELKTNLELVIQNYPNSSMEEKSTILVDLKDYYLKNKYILRISETLNKFANQH